jgi:hypothetical protein
MTINEARGSTGGGWPESIDVDAIESPRAEDPLLSQSDRGQTGVSVEAAAASAAAAAGTAAIGAMAGRFRTDLTSTSTADAPAPRVPEMTGGAPGSEADRDMADALDLGPDSAGYRESASPADSPGAARRTGE